jgi:hypothetical protein
MRGFATLFLALMVGSFALPADPALAQNSKSKGAQPRAVPTDPNALAQMCSQLVFRKYGQRNTLYGPRTVEMPLELHARLQNSCIMSKGRNY